MGACACFLGGLLDKLLSALVYQRCFDLLEFRLIICRSREKLWVLLISTLCVSCWWGQTGCPSTLCHPVVEARRQSEIILLAAGSWEVCVCVPLSTSISWKQAGWHQPAAAHLHLLTNEPIIYGGEGGEFSGGKLSWHTKTQMLNSSSTAGVEPVNLILANIHVRGEGDTSLVLAFFPVPST